MTDAEAIEVAVARTGYSPYRENLDPAAPHYDPRLWPIVRAIAAAPPPAPAAGPRPEPPAPDPRTRPFRADVERAVLACADRVKSATGCGCSSCRLLGRTVEHHECWDCRKRLMDGG